MSAAQNSMLEEASSVASRDQASLDQVQQTAAVGQAHVKGKLMFLSALYEAFGKCCRLPFYRWIVVTDRALRDHIERAFLTHYCIADVLTQGVA